MGFSKPWPKPGPPSLAGKTAADRTTSENRPFVEQALHIFMDQQRTEHLVWAENARGLAIFLVVLGHAAIPAQVKAAIYGFHMHLFFFLSGLFFSARLPFGSTTAKKARTLILPYLLYGFLGYGIWLFRILVVHNAPSGINLIYPFFDILTFRSFWFLPVLFVVTLLFYPVHGLVTRKTYLPFLVMLALLHSATQAYGLTPYVGTLVHAFNALVFFGFGFLYRQHTQPSDWRIGAGAAVIFAVAFLLGYPSYGLETIGRVSNYFYAYTLAFTGIVASITLCYRIPRNPIFSFLGVNSLLIYLLHNYPGALYSRVFASMGITQSALPPVIYGLLQACTNILLLTPGILIINRFLPWTLGKSPTFKHR